MAARALAIGNTLLAFNVLSHAERNMSEDDAKTEGKKAKL